MMTPNRILVVYGRIYPAWEYEIDTSHERTGRRRAQQFERTMRYEAVPPDRRVSLAFCMV